jgi:hypothetical protein
MVNYLGKFFPLMTFLKNKIKNKRGGALSEEQVVHHENLKIYFMWPKLSCHVPEMNLMLWGWRYLSAAVTAGVDFAIFFVVTGLSRQHMSLHMAFVPLTMFKGFLTYMALIYFRYKAMGDLVFIQIPILQNK